jgi:hypothetical protein
MTAAIETYISAFFSGEVRAFWPHFWLLGGALLGGIAVGIGIILETPESPSRKQRIAMWLVIIGIVIEPICTLVLFAFDEGISDAQNSEIIALIKNNLPRSIDVSAFSEQLTGGPPARVEIRYVVACSDCEFLSFWLSEALKKAQWSIESIIPITPQDRDWVRAIHSLHAQSSGITVVIGSPDKITADPTTSLGVLFRALNQALGFNFLGFNSSVSGGVDITMPPEMIRIVVAPKA